ncbi:DUF4232 domain-containing protein [Streptomyces tsukubensis]|uniref:DUF4232 domain-containing protein n=1 Tax=Streptomyces tsukubensis TaxID=83656 RepID=A0A1V4A8Z9_9ACTN|nr:DUF4232 domain-containing protein [Streptomyces tsukubensis]OON79643.1 hypothetical protein B1H18_13820 [Streptomyces tsukubensis]QFR95829.1 DUF4232 domain-containing protein [Streptomyces tsukubensis]
MDIRNQQQPHAHQDSSSAGQSIGRGRRRSVRRLAVPVAAAALLGLAGAGAAQAATASGATAAANPTCATSGLSVSFGKKLGGGTMHEGTVLKLKNTSSHTCALRGYPGLGLEDANHKTLTSHAAWGDTWYAKDPGKKTLTLKAGQSAEAVIGWTHANTGTSDAQHAAYLTVTPPASTAHKTLKLDTWVDGGTLDVTPVAYKYDVTS